MKYLETKLELEEAMESDKPKKEVYELYNNFEEAYSHVAKKRRDCNERLDMYFKFLKYMERNKK